MVVDGSDCFLVPYYNDGVGLGFGVDLQNYGFHKRLLAPLFPDIFPHSRWVRFLLPSRWMDECHGDDVAVQFFSADGTRNIPLAS